MKTIFEYLLSKANNKAKDDIDELVNNFPETLNFDEELLRIELTSIINLDYIPLSYEPFYEGNNGNACFYIFKKLGKRKDFALTFVGHRSFFSNKPDVLAISYTSNKKNISYDGEKTVPVSMLWGSSHANILYNMQESVSEYLVAEHFGPYQDNIRLNTWWARGRFHMMSSQKTPRKIYNVQSFFNVK